MLYTAAGCRLQQRRPEAKIVRKCGLFALALLLATFSLMTPPVRAQKSSRARAEARGSSSKWIEQTLKKMTLREKLGQLLMVPYFGVFEPTDSPEYKKVLHEVEENNVGGLIIVTDRGTLGLERSQVYATAIITNE